MILSTIGESYIRWYKYEKCSPWFFQTKMQKNFHESFVDALYRTDQYDFGAPWIWNKSRIPALHAPLRSLNLIFLFFFWRREWIFTSVKWNINIYSDNNFVDIYIHRNIIDIYLHRNTIDILSKHHHYIMIRPISKHHWNFKSHHHWNLVSHH